MCSDAAVHRTQRQAGDSSSTIGCCDALVAAYCHRGRAKQQQAAGGGQRQEQSPHTHTHTHTTSTTTTHTAPQARAGPAYAHGNSGRKASSGMLPPL